MHLRQSTVNITIQQDLLYGHARLVNYQSYSELTENAQNYLVSELSIIRYSKTDKLYLLSF
jgi:hypothetical protein